MLKSFYIPILKIVLYKKYVHEKLSHLRLTSDPPSDLNPEVISFPTIALSDKLWTCFKQRLRLVKEQFVFDI